MKLQAKASETPEPCGNHRGFLALPGHTPHRDGRRKEAAPVFQRYLFRPPPPPNAAGLLAKLATFRGAEWGRGGWRLITCVLCIKKRRLRKQKKHGGKKTGWGLLPTGAKFRKTGGGRGNRQRLRRGQRHEGWGVCGLGRRHVYPRIHQKKHAAVAPCPNTPPGLSAMGNTHHCSVDGEGWGAEEALEKAH